MKSGKYIDDDIKIESLVKGDKLYHYTTAQSVHGILESESFWVTKHDFLNDKEEFEYAHKLFSEKILSELNDEKIKKEIKKRLEKEIKDNMSGKGSFLNGYYVLSFSLNSDSLALWSEFSEEAGYCIEFDYDTLEKTLEMTFRWEGKVVYDRELQLKNMRNHWVEFWEKMFETPYAEIVNSSEINISEELLDGLVLHVFTLCSLYGMFYKKPEFKSEEEYRFVFWISHDENMKGKNKLPLCFRVKNDTMIPYVEIKCNIIGATKTITIGPKNNMDIAKRGMELYCASKGMKVKVKKSKIPLRY